MELKIIKSIIDNKKQIKKERKIQYADLFNIPKSKSKTKSKTKKNK